MANLVPFHGANGHQVWVNVDLVRSVAQSGREVALSFASDHQVLVKGAANEVADRIATAAQGA